MTDGFTLPIPEALIDGIARRVAEIVLAELGTTTTATPYMTIDEAAEYLRWSKERIYKLTAAQAIPHIKHEGRLLFRRDKLDLWLEQHHEGPRVRDTATAVRRTASGG